MGRCKEWAKVVGDDKVDERILAMRHDALPSVPKAAKATQPERVLTYRSAGLLSARLHCCPLSARKDKRQGSYMHP